MPAINVFFSELRFTLTLCSCPPSFAQWEWYSLLQNNNKALKPTQIFEDKASCIVLPYSDEQTVY
jgi:hypothetical protein